LIPVKGAGLQSELVQKIDIVNVAATQINMGRNDAPQVQQSVYLEGTAAVAKGAPGEQRQTPIDAGGIEHVNGRGQVDSERFVAVEFAGHANQYVTCDFFVGDLSSSKVQTKELIPTGEVFDLAIALVSVDANLKLMARIVG
jgi:hypothetical protein